MRQFFPLHRKPERPDRPDVPAGLDSPRLVDHPPMRTNCSAGRIRSRKDGRHHDVDLRRQ